MSLTLNLTASIRKSSNRYGSLAEVASSSALSYVFEVSRMPPPPPREAFEGSARQSPPESRQYVFMVIRSMPAEHLYGLPQKDWGGPLPFVYFLRGLCFLHQIPRSGAGTMGCFRICHSICHPWYPTLPRLPNVYVGRLPFHKHSGRRNRLSCKPHVRLVWRGHHKHRLSNRDRDYFGLDPRRSWLGPPPCCCLRRPFPRLHSYLLELFRGSQHPNLPELLLGSFTLCGRQMGSGTYKGRVVVRGFELWTGLGRPYFQSAISSGPSGTCLAKASPCEMVQPGNLHCGRIGTGGSHHLRIRLPPSNSTTSLRVGIYRDPGGLVGLCSGQTLRVHEVLLSPLLPALQDPMVL